MTFKEWMKQVDALVMAKLFVTTSDLPDANFRDSYDDGVSPEDFAHDFISDTLYDEGMDDGDF